MDNKAKNEEVEIDLLHLLKLLWRKAWIIVIAMILIGAILFTYSMVFITPRYTSTAMMYVNNSSLSLGGASFTISASELSAAKSLLDVYVIILKTRITLERVIEEADLDYTYETLNSMVSASSVNGTEVFKISVTSSDPEEAELIADTIVHILPDRIADVVDGSSVRLVERAVCPSSKSAPNCTNYAIIGMIIGLILSIGLIIIFDLMDTTVRDEDYLNQKYDIPVLAVVPDAYTHKKGSYSYYRYSYGKNPTEDK